MRCRWALSTVCAAVWISAGCGGSKSDAQSQAALDACRQLHQATGQVMAACNSGAAADWQTYWDDLAPCTTYARHVGDGSVKYVAAALPACLGEIQSSLCETPSTCEYTRVFVGQVPDGAPCADFSVCGPQSLCPSTVCNATCEALGGAALGASCDGTYCQTGLYCDMGSRVCVGATPAGGACRGNSGVGCVPGFDCLLTGMDAAGNLTGTCAARVDRGPCTWDYNCVAGQFCDQGTCRPYLREGDACGDVPNGCGAFTACDTSSPSPSCVHAGRLGEPCGPLNTVPWICLDGSVCNGQFKCEAAGQVGDGCTALTCAPPLVCGPGTCIQCPSPDAGQP